MTEVHTTEMTTNPFEETEVETVKGPDAGARAMVARDEGEIKAMVIVAHEFPRDERDAYAKAIGSCQRFGFASTATYSFPRGGKQVTGPSINLAREMKRCWRNLKSGVRTVSDDGKHIVIEAIALDLETNVWSATTDSFRALIQRGVKGKTQWVEPDERDRRELVNRRGAICERNAILSLLPPDFIADCEREAKKTVADNAKGKTKQDKAGAIRAIVAGFREVLVTEAMLEEYLKCKLDAITPDQLSDLRGVYTSISDGNSRADEYFSFGAPQATTTESTAAVNDALSKRREAKEDAGTHPQQAEKPFEEPKPSRPEPATKDPLHNHITELLEDCQRLEKELALTPRKNIEGREKFLGVADLKGYSDAERLAAYRDWLAEQDKAAELQF